MGILENKVALVTGGARGIGRAIAVALADEGAHIAFTDIKLAADSDELVAMIKAKGLRAMAIQSDVRDFTSTQSLAESVIKEMQRIDILVNNAGITRDNLLIRMSEDEWDAVIDTNLKGSFNFCKAFAPHMIRQRQGKIINIASVSWPHRECWPGELLCIQGRHDRPDKSACKRAWFSQYSGQRGRSRVRGNRDDQQAQCRAKEGIGKPNPSETRRKDTRDCGSC